jgi:hypothetical protein
MMIGRSCVTRHCDARFKQIAFVGLILHRNPHRHGLQALEASGRLEVRALFAAMERRSALGTLALPIDILRQRGGAIETTSGYNVLEQPRKARSGDVDRRPGARWLGPVGQCAVPGPTVGVHVAPLSVLTVVVHV